MRAARVVSNGSPTEVIEIQDDVPVPEPEAGGVRVQVAAASLNWGDIARCRGGVASLDDMERETILQALTQTHGNKKKAAELLGIQRPTLYNKMKRYAIEI